jgi:hypothetical protein
MQPVTHGQETSRWKATSAYDEFLVTIGVLVVWFAFFGMIFAVVTALGRGF